MSSIQTALLGVIVAIETGDPEKPHRCGRIVNVYFDSKFSEVYYTVRFIDGTLEACTGNELIVAPEEVADFNRELLTEFIK